MTSTTATWELPQMLLAELEQEAQATRRVLQRVPGDKLSWRPHPRSSSLGQLALHVAIIPSLGLHVLGPDVLEAPEFAQPEPRTGAELLPALEESLASARQFLSELTPERAQCTWKLVRGGRELMAAPRMAMVRTLMFNHLYHHRGSLVVYLRLLDVPLPSVYGPSADEKPFG
ncbi:MAG TPA: DinB family protein [Gemmatimonadales bacterium]|nr:DinB family protein [Gemmatimonadales bacterium]